MDSSPRILLLLIATTPFVLGRSASAQGPGPLDDFKVNAGPDLFLLPEAQTLTLSATVQGQVIAPQPGSSGIAITWIQLGGPPAQILDANSLRPTIVPSRPGTLRLRVKVTLDQTARSDEILVHALGAAQSADVQGIRRKWHKLALTFTHSDVLAETGTPNPFLDLRLQTQFFHPASGSVEVVPGFFAADGNAAETSATAGTSWRVNFTPDRAGDWYYVASFRSGSQVALSSDPEAGTALGFDGANGVFSVAPADPNAPGLLSKGRLDYVGGHHLRFAETGEAFLKGGAGSPENFFGYYEFDGTFDLGGTFNDLNTTPPFDGLHHYNAHLADYVDLGVPLWKNGKGRRAFGALNYLSSRGVNSLYALSYNADGGDGQEIWPWANVNDKLRFDVSKLAQWERVLDHMNRAGIVWHMVTQETENDHVLDGGALDTQRRLYYRELVARFGWANGLIWNLGEENTNTPEERRSFADTIRALDSNAHPIALHNIVGDIEGTFGTLLGTHLEVLSVQGHPVNTPPRVRQLVLDSAAAGRPWVVNFDEQTPANDGIVPDAVDFWHDLIRRESLWPMLLGQGGGCEWYFGYGNPNDDLDCEDFRSRENMWLLTRRAREFVRDTVPFDEMQHADGLATGNGPSVLAKQGEHYLVYLPFGGPATLDLQGAFGTFLVSWFDARNGGPLLGTAVAQVDGPGVVALGSPPGPGDWVAWVRRALNFPPQIEAVAVEPPAYEAGRDFALLVRARDPNGPADELSVTAKFFDPSGTFRGLFPLPYRGGRLYSLFVPNAAPIEAGLWQVQVRVRDASGVLTTSTASFEAR